MFSGVINYLELPAATTVTGLITVSSNNLGTMLLGNNLDNEDTPLDLNDYRDDKNGVSRDAQMELTVSSAYSVGVGTQA